MNREAFQIYGLKKTGIFQSTWDTTLVSALGVELAGVAASGSGWSSTTNLNTIESTHTPGFTSNLVTSRAATAMQTYQIVCTVTGTTGNIQVMFGNNTSAAISPGTTTITLMALNTNALTIIPSSSFNGNVKLSVKSSSSAANQIKLPLPNSGTYNIWVDWGDGTYDNITSYDSIKTLHTYPAPGTYTVRITGDRFNWFFGYNIINDKAKIKTVSSWGKLKLGTQSFFACINLNLSGVNDVPDLTGVTNFYIIFDGCSNLTTIGRSNEWNTSSITNMGGLFSNCTNFNSNISNWNVVNVTSFLNTFSNCTNFNNGYAPGVYNQLPWTINTTSNVDMQGIFLNATSFNANLGNGVTPWNVTKVTVMNSMFAGASKFNNGFASGVAGTMVWNTISATAMTSMFQSASAFNQNIGSWNVSNVYEFGGMFYLASKFNNGGSSDINNWVIKNTGTVFMYTMFQSAIAFNQPLGNWNTSNVTLMSSMFQSATAFNQDLSTWNTGAVTTMFSMFNSAFNFNNGFASGIANQLTWNTSACTTMASMFQSAPAFNSNLGTGTTPWNVSNVITFANMFQSASNFNNGDDTAPINNWNINTASDVSMASMFQSAVVFNRYVNDWNVSKVTNMAGMFNSAFNFNNGFASGIANQLTWNTSACTTMASMFQSAPAFNSNLGTGTTPWNVSNVITFANMFQSASNFNNGDDTAPINNWNTVSNVTMASMFGNASKFNRDISSWNVSKVTTFASMFNGATAFNNGLASGVVGTMAWNTISATAMTSMFQSAIAFNQNIGSWNMSKVNNMSKMFYRAGNFNNGGDASINTWNLSNISSAVQIFDGDGVTMLFNQPINDWNVINFNFTAMFRNCINFNQPIDNWNVSNVTSMGAMFNNTQSFNQPLANWERVGSTLANVTDMNSMFQGATAFKQYIGNWNISNVNNFINFMLGKTPTTFPSTYLDAIYNGWIVNGVKPNINISFGTAKYSQAAKTGRAVLTNPVGYNWTIADGLLTVSGTSNNGVLIRLTTNSNGFTIGTSVLVNVYDVLGTTNANGTWTALVISSTVIELQGSNYNGAWTGGGNVILG